MSSGAARQASAAISSSLVAYGVASHSVLGSRRLARPTAASFQLRMCVRASCAVGRSRCHVRTVRSAMRRRVGEVLAEHEHDVGALHVAERAEPQAAARDLEHDADELVVGVGHAVVEVRRSDERAQRVVGLERRPRRADADHAAAAHQSRRRVQGAVAPLLDGLLPALGGQHRRPPRHARGAHPLGSVDVGVAEAPAVAEPHLVDVAVVAARDAAQLAVPRPGVHVAAQPAVLAHGRRRLQVPLARVVPRQRLVGEHAGGADLDEVAAELALQRARPRRARSTPGCASRRRRSRDRRRSRCRSACSGSR